MGLKSWKNAPDGKIVKTDVSIAKNYLEKEELAELNEIVCSSGGLQVCLLFRE